MMLFGACKQKTEAPVEQNTDNIYQFTVLDGNLDTVNIADYQGKVLLVVNTATQCGFTPQYEELQKLYDLYRDKGFEILDFPCNQFGQQAPGTNEEIHAFCTGTYNVTFPQMARPHSQASTPPCPSERASTRCSARRTASTTRTPISSGTLPSSSSTVTAMWCAASSPTRAMCP